MRLTGNKGEWSELYAFVKLLSTGRLYTADENVNRVAGVYFPILKIFRKEGEGLDMEYVIKSADGSVEVHWNADVVRDLKRTELKNMATYLYTAIVSGGNRAFEIEKSSDIMNALACSKIAAPSNDKTDITLQIHDINTGYEPVCGFSIKSELGSPPTLLNASGATNFKFEVIGLTDEQAAAVNAIDTPTKILDRIKMIRQLGQLKFCTLQSNVFAGNLMLIDSYMDDIISNMLVDYYARNIADCKSLVRSLENKNPLGYPRKGLYEYKFKKFLCAIALGMKPATQWDGTDEANGGYIIVKDDGDVLAYHIYNRNSFETYLLNNTKFEKGSTSKHGFATIYEESNGKKYINLNLQIRFI